MGQILTEGHKFECMGFKLLDKMPRPMRTLDEAVRRSQGKPLWVGKDNSVVEASWRKSAREILTCVAPWLPLCGNIHLPWGPPLLVEEL